MVNVFLALVAYVVGAIPCGYLFAKYFFHVDVTRHGSGNIGATNVARVLGSKAWFFLVFLCDFGKAFLFLFLCTGALSFKLLLACLLLIGNAHSVFLKFRGGKGVATSLGILAALFPVLFFIFLIIWAVLLGVSRRVDVASLLSFVAIVGIYFFVEPILLLHALFLFFLVGWVILRHRENIIALVRNL